MATGSEQIPPPSTAGVPASPALRSLGGKALIYGAGSITLKALTFFLIPVYSRYMTPAEYGFVGIALTISSILGILYPLGLHGALNQTYYAAKEDLDRSGRVGTLWSAIALSALGMTLALDAWGAPLFDLVLKDIPFSPYVRLAIWTSLFSSLGLISLNLLQLRERPALYVGLTVLSAILTVGLTIERVVFRRLGALGYLQASAWAAGLMVIPLTIVLKKQARPTLRADVLRPALLYSLPLIPHGLAGWVLSLSDRLILERHVPMAELGLYQFGAQIASALTIIATAINTAWTPFLFRTHQERGESAASDLARLATYQALVLVWATLGLALLARHVLHLLAAPAYHPAARVIPWLAGGLLMNGLYMIPAGFLFLTSRTYWIPVGTILSGAVAVVFNLTLVPRYGIMATAWGSIVGNATLLLVIWAAARRVYRLPYEYRRIALLLVCGAATFAAGQAIRLDSPLFDAGLRLLAWMCFPLLLLLTGFFTSPELGQLRQLLGRPRGFA